MATETSAALRTQIALIPHALGPYGPPSAHGVAAAAALARAVLEQLDDEGSRTDARPDLGDLTEALLCAIVACGEQYKREADPAGEPYAWAMTDLANLLAKPTVEGPRDRAA